MTNGAIEPAPAAASVPAGPSRHPRVRFQPKGHRRYAAGCPWVYSNEIEMTPEAKQIAPGSLVTLETAGGEPMGTVMFNPHNLVVARAVAAKADAALDVGLIAERIAAAFALRRRLFPGPYFRLVHSEADRLPGLIVDLFGETAVIQTNSAGMDARIEAVVEAVCTVTGATTVVVKNDSALRSLEGLPSDVRVARGTLGGRTEIVENGCRFVCDLDGGQKTGWFYDQRINRAMVASLAQGASVLDVYCYLGGFGIQAAAAGAREVLLVDRSEPALALAMEAAELNGVADRVSTHRSEAFPFLEKAVREGRTFDVVVSDPPAFVKSRKDLGAGLRGYRKMTRLSALLTAPGGFLFVASCSHNVDAQAFADEVRRALAEAGRTGRILRSAGAAPDHPVHPFLPETSYLKGVFLQLD